MQLTNTKLSIKYSQRTKKYVHLSLSIREQITILLASKNSATEISRQTGYHRSTIYRELKRNKGDNAIRYSGVQAQEVSQERAQKSHRRERLRDAVIKKYVEEHIKYWSPEIISGRLKKDLPGYSISHESIYQWIYALKPSLRVWLPRRHIFRKPYTLRAQPRRLSIPNSVPISERPKHISENTEFGNYEIDTVISGKSKAGVCVAVEKKTRFYICALMSAVNKFEMQEQMIKIFSKLPKQAVRTFTYDNGKENFNHEVINEKLNTKSYFCRPYHSWEKGQIENRNTMLRRFFHKKTDWALITPQLLASAVHEINSRPIKCLNYKTPYELWNKDISPFVALAY
jgi:IS30 family transposase